MALGYKTLREHTVAKVAKVVEEAGNADLQAALDNLLKQKKILKQTLNQQRL